MWQNFFGNWETKTRVLSSIFTISTRIHVKIFSQLKISLVTIIVFFSSAGLDAQICYPFIKRQYFTNTEKVVSTRQFSSWNTMAVSNRSKGFWAAGYGTVNGAGHGDGWLMKYDDTGKFVGAIRYGVKGTGSNEIMNDVATTPSGGAVVVGSSVVGSVNAALGVVSYFTPGGKLKWTRESPSSSRNGQPDVFNHVLVYDANTIVVVGSGSQLTGKRNLIAAQLDSNGATKWTLNVDMGNNEHHGWGVARVGGEWVITGWCRSTQTFPFAVFVKTDGTVRSLWKGTSNGISQFGHVLVAPGGTIYTVGTTGANLTAQILVCAFTADGTRKWTRSIGANNVLETGHHLVLEGGSLWLSSTYQTFVNNRQLLVQIDTATGATTQTQKILANGNTNYALTGFMRSFVPMPKGGMVAIGVDNSAGVHNNFMINSPCNTNCGTATSTVNNTALTWTWASSTSYTATSYGDLAVVNFDTASFYINQAINCTQVCPMPIKVVSSPLVLCPSTTSVSTNATQALAESYAWTDGGTSPTRTFTTEGTFYINTINACGTRQDTVVVGKASAPVKPNLKDTLFCKNPFNYTIDVAQPFCKYVWDNGSTLSTRTFTKPGVFWLDTRNACGSRVDSVRFKLLLPPVSPKIADTGVCVGKNIIVDFPKVPASLYTWSDGDTMVPKTFFSSTKATLRVTNLCGVAFDTFDIKIKLPPTKSRVKDTTFCNRFFAWDLDMTHPDVRGYQWDDLTGSPQRVIMGTGKFWLTMTNDCGARTDTFFIFTDTVPEKRLVGEEFFCSGVSYVLKGAQFSGYSKYLWNTGAKTGNLNVTQSGLYSLHTFNACGERRDTVKVNALRCDCKMWMPTAFSPYSSQGLNDEVKPMFVDDWGKLCGVKTGTWSVYNRWGECVFDKRPVTEAWNGLYMDEPVMTGMYVYIVNVTFDETVSGFRNMIRQGTILVVDAKK